MIQADPSGRFVLHVDLGSDQIFVWKFDEQTGVLSPNEPPAVSLPAGDGPRHFQFHPNGCWLYSIQEEGSTIVLFDYAVFRVSRKTGGLSFTGHYTPVGIPSIIIFLDLAKAG